MTDKTPIVRQWTLLRTLAARRHGVGVRELAEELGVSIKTIRRDLDVLTELGFPLRSEEAAHGAKRWRAEWDRRMPPLGLDVGEVLSLYLCRTLMTPLAGTVAWESLQSLFSKLRGCLPQSSLAYLDTLAAAIDSTAFRTSDYTRHGAIIDDLIVAIEDRQSVLAGYRSAKATESATYEIDPYGLTYHRGSLYLVGHSDRHDEVRSFKVDRVSRVDIQERTFERPRDFDLTAYHGGSLGVFHGEAPPQTVAIRFAPEAARYAQEHHWHESQRIVTEPDGWVRLEMELSTLEETVTWVLSFRGLAIALEPPELRQRVWEAAARILESHGSEAGDGSGPEVGHPSEHPVEQAIRDRDRRPTVRNTTKPDCGRTQQSPDPVDNGRSEAWRLLWAKLGSGRYPEEAHPLACHLIDVASVAQVLWRVGIAASVRRRWSEVLGLSEGDAGRWVAFWAGCHDIGKACPAFQFRVEGVEEHLEAAGLRPNGETDASRGRHDHVSMAVLPNLWTKTEETDGWPAIDKHLAGEIAHVIGGHHGTIPKELADLEPGRAELGDAAWTTVRRELLGRLAESLSVGSLQVPSVPPDLKGNSRDSGLGPFRLLLGGLIAASDWIGSNRELFPRLGELRDRAAWDTYVSHATKRAEDAVAKLRWTGWDPGHTRPAPFAELFSRFAPRPLQVTTDRLVQRLDRPALVLVEAPMGEGKTEAALAAADYFTHALGGRGAYLAMPTTATSNGLFKRVESFLSERYGSERVNLQLLHGQNFLSKDFARLRTDTIGEDIETSGGKSGRVVAEQWFAEDRRQGLLAPFAVGTVDQALMAIVQTRFSFVRLLGLSGRTIVVDEVHAYDAFTSTILCRLLRWLGAIGSPVLLLSATLPASARRELVDAYLGREGSPHRRRGGRGGRSRGRENAETVTSVSLLPDGVPYPRVTVVPEDAGKPDDILSEGFEADPARRRDIRLSRIGWDTLADRLIKTLAEGGTAAVVCNTVGQAQRTFDDLQVRLAQAGIEVQLFHARFTLEDRQRIETAVLQTYCEQEPPDLRENGLRPARVLVATQVVEQSLDLDFDLIVSEVAPIDLLLQRAGRLWRHDRPARPTAEPELLLIEPESAPDGVPTFGAFEDKGEGGVYFRNILLRSNLLLRGRETLTLPDEIEALVETVYAAGGDDGTRLNAPDKAWRTALIDSAKDMADARQTSRENALGGLVAGPFKTDLLRKMNLDLLEEDDPEAHPQVRGRTREGDPTVSLVLAYRTASGRSLTPDGAEPIVTETRPNEAHIRRLIERSVSVSHQKLVQQFAKQPTSPGWAECGPLRYLRILELDSEGAAQTSIGTVRYDAQRGLVLPNRP